MKLLGGRLAVIAVFLISVAATTRGYSAGCQEGSFETWLDGVKSEAAEKGISQHAIAAGLSNVSFDRSVISHDRGQGVFRQSFEQFSSRMVNSYRLQKGSSLIRQYTATFNRIEQQFGVPAPVIVAIWGLETDFGANSGNFPTIRSLATLAYDCRRSDMFRAELMDALRLVERGDLSPSEMRGAWAGELGQTQFMPSSYLKFAVDFDGTGRRDLIRDVPDVLASTANYLKSYGWQKGGSWTPGSDNFNILLVWNKSQVYSKTVAYFATRLSEMTGK
jgi:lytic murein transglycosylase